MSKPRFLHLLAAVSIFAAITSRAWAGSEQAAPETAPETAPPPVEHWKGVLIGVSVPIGIMGGGALSWWLKHAPDFRRGRLVFRDRGWLGENTYAGGHDKIGHLFANYYSQYAVTAMYESVGYGRTLSIVLAGGITFIAFNLVELLDGLTDYGWEYGDSVFNLLGQAYAIVAQLHGLDRFVHLRISWVPSRSYLERKRFRRRIAFLEDYDGQRYFLLANSSGILGELGLAWWPLALIDPGIYFDTRGYRPKTQRTVERQRNLGVALVLDCSVFLRLASSGDGAVSKFASVFQVFQPSIVVGYGYDLNNHRWHAPDATLTFSSQF